MSSRLRHKGRLVNKQDTDQKIKVKNISLRKKATDKKNKNEGSGPSRSKLICEGNRIIDLTELAKNLICYKCKTLLSLNKIVSEETEGLKSTLQILCETCNQPRKIPTAKNNSPAEASTSPNSDINAKAVLGAIHLGISCGVFNKILKCLDIPTIPERVFKSYEKEATPTTDQVAKRTRLQTAEYEKKKKEIKNNTKLF